MRGNQKRTRQAYERGHRDPEGQEVQCREGHFACANLERQEVVSKAGLGRGSEDQKDHQRTVKRGESGKTIRRVAEAGEEREMHARPDQVDTHEQRHGHAEENAEEREPKVLEANGLVARAEKTAGQKPSLR